MLQGSDIQNSFSVYGCDVDIISSKASGSTTTSSGSNKVCKLFLYILVTSMYISDFGALSKIKV